MIVVEVGNQKIPVQADDFASEATLQQLVNVSTAMAQSISQQSRNDTRQNTNDSKQTEALTRIAQNTGESRTMRGLNALGSAATGLTAATMNLATSIEGMKTSQLVSNIGQAGSDLASLLPGKLGTVMEFAADTLTSGATMLVGMMEKLGASFNTLRRVGVGFGTELEKIRMAAANSGMQLDAFAALLAQNGVTVKSLGDSTGTGALKLAELSDTFYKVTQNFGNFGMGMTEINQLLLDEIEIRRQSGMDVRNLSTNFTILGNAITENARRQEAMSRMTGEDMRARMAAQREALSDTRVRAALVGAGEDLIANFRTLNSALLRFDPTGDLRSALQQSFATGFDPMAFAPELIAVLGPGVQGLLGEAQNAMRTMDPGQFANWFEKNMAAQMETMSNNEDYRQQLIMMTHSTNSALANAANSVLESMTSMSKGNINLAESLRLTQDMGDAASYAEMSANMERFGAALSMRLTDVGLGFMKGISNQLDNLGVDKSDENFANIALQEMRSVLMTGETTSGYGADDLKGSILGALSALGESASNALGLELASASLQTQEEIRINTEQMNLSLGVLVNRTLEAPTSSSDSVGPSNYVIHPTQTSTIGFNAVNDAYNRSIGGGGR